MTDLSDEERERLADVVRLQPTKNGDLGDRWGIESGSEVHQYLEGHLADLYYRDEDSYIRATPEAASLVDAEPGVVDGDDGPSVVRVDPLAARALDVVARPDERSESVVSVLDGLREQFDLDPTAEAVRSALQSLKRFGLVEVERRTVPTFRLATDAPDVTVEERADPDDATEESDAPGGVLETVESEFEER